MSGKDLLVGMSYINAKFVDEAEKIGLQEGEINAATRAKQAQKRGGTWKKGLLLAACVALMTLLLGCAVVYVLRMQNLKVGEEQQTQPVFDTNGMYITGYQDVNYQVMTLGGLKGSAGYQAAEEWYAFKKVYDPDYAILQELDRKKQIPEYPEAYSSYNLYTQEMKDRLDEILTKYDLKPEGALLHFRTVQNMCAALGIEKFQTSCNDVVIQVVSGGCRENGNFDLTLNMKLPEDGESEVGSSVGLLCWNRKDCFSEDLISIADTGDWQEWNYTTASGSNVLIIRSPSDWRGWIICEREEGLLSLMVEARIDSGYNVDGRNWFESAYMTDRQLEWLADAIDFSIQPKLVGREDVQSQPAVPAEATQDGYTLALKSVETDGWAACVYVGVTAPEGVVISRDTRPGYEDVCSPLNTGQMPKITPVSGTGKRGLMYLSAQEDGDGLDNTHDLRLAYSASTNDGQAPFAPGSVWKIQIEDLVFRGGDRFEERLAQGEWEMEVSFHEGNGDYREIELIREPITTKASTGWRPDGTDVLEDVTVTSFVLRRLSATLVTDREGYAQIGYNASNEIYAVMNDGKKIALSGVAFLEPERAIDLDQVAYVLLPDGTKLMP